MDKTTTAIVCSARNNSDRPMKDSGFGLIEVLVSIVILSIVGLATARSSITAMSSLQRSQRNTLAYQLAMTKLESMISIDPTGLDSGDNSTESSIIAEGAEFTRTVAIVVNTDQSRQITVSVAPKDLSLGGVSTISHTVSLWGNT